MKPINIKVRHMVRGGSWDDNARYCRVGFRLRRAIAQGSSWACDADNVSTLPLDIYVHHTNYYTSVRFVRGKKR